MESGVMAASAERRHIRVATGSQYLTLGFVASQSQQLVAGALDRSALAA
jgi:hypothetical protein